MLNDKQKKKKSSKTFVGLKRIYDSERTTLDYLKKEAEALNSDVTDIDADGIKELLQNDIHEMRKEIEYSFVDKVWKYRRLCQILCFAR